MWRCPPHPQGQPQAELLLYPLLPSQEGAQTPQRLPLPHLHPLKGLLAAAQPLPLQHQSLVLQAAARGVLGVALAMPLPLPLQSSHPLMLYLNLQQALAVEAAWLAHHQGVAAMGLHQVAVRVVSQQVHPAPALMQGVQAPAAKLRHCYFAMATCMFVAKLHGLCCVIAGVVLHLAEWLCTGNCTIARI